MLYLKLPLLLLFIFITSIHSASTLLHNIKGYTSTDQGLLHFEGLLFDDNGIVEKTLNQHSVIKLLAENDNLNIIDGKGNYLFPGLTDAHGHVLGYGQALSSVDLTETRSAEDAAEKVASFVEQNPDNQWITGRGWNQVLWQNGRFPEAETLDRIVSSKPVVLSRIDGHALWINSRAMKIAGINRDTLDPEGGELLRDVDGNPTGILVDNAMELVRRKMPSLSTEKRKAALKKALFALAKVGLTSVHDAGVAPVTIDAYKTLAEKGELPIRVYAMLDVTSKGYQKRLKQGPQKSLYQDYISVQSVKISIDGALGSRGAALDAPYSDRSDTRGLLLHSESETEALTLEGMKAGFQVNSHAIGDRGNRLLLDIFAKYPKYQHLRNRIEHAQVVHLDDIPRFKALNIIPSMQPTHATSDKNMAKDRLGEQRLEGAYAWRKFLNLDVIIASGSDFPVEPANPFYGLHAAVTRQDRKNKPVGGWRIQDRMTRAEALRSFTLDAAYAAHQEKILGSLEQGKWADFILLDKDYFTVEAKDIWKIKVLQTWVAGKRVY